MPSFEELERLLEEVEKRSSTDCGRRAFLELMRSYLPPSLASSWLAENFAGEFAEMVGDSAAEWRENMRLRQGELPELVSISQDLARVAAFPTNDDASSYLMYVQKGRNKIGSLKEGLFFPVRWVCSSTNDEYKSDDPRLPSSLLIVADRVRRTLKVADAEARFGDQYESWTLQFLRASQPKWDRSDDAGNEQKILDAIFQGENSSDSAAASLLVSLFVSVRGGRSNPYCLGTGVGRLSSTGVYEQIVSVAATLPNKVQLALKFSEDINRGGDPTGDKGDRECRPVTLFVPAGQVGDALKELENLEQNAILKGLLRIEAFGAEHSVDQLLSALRPMRAVYQTRPVADDPITSQQTYFLALGSQLERSAFHTEVMQKGAGSDHVVPKLRAQWNEAVNVSNVESSKNVDAVPETFCVSIMSRSWELPFLDWQVFQPNKALVLWPNDLESVSQEESGLPNHAFSMRMDRVSGFLKLNIQIERCPLDLQAINRETVSDPMERAQQTCSLIRQCVHAWLEKHSISSELLENNEARLIINRTSGSQFLSNCLVEAPPDGAFIVVYWGETDPLTNQPKPGSHDLVVYRKTGQLGLERITGPAAQH